MILKKSTKLGKLKYFIFLIFLQFINFNSYSDSMIQNEKYAEINILDKVSSKSSKVTVEIGKEVYFQNLNIKVMKCRNSKFDDDPEVTAYLQVRDLKTEDKDKVFIFNGWTFASSPSIKPFDHPVYDIWLKKCYS